VMEGRAGGGGGGNKKQLTVVSLSQFWKRTRSTPLAIINQVDHAYGTARCIPYDRTRVWLAPLFAWALTVLDRLAIAVVVFCLFCSAFRNLHPSKNTSYAAERLHRVTSIWHTMAIRVCVCVRACVCVRVCAYVGLTHASMGSMFFRNTHLLSISLSLSLSHSLLSPYPYIYIYIYTYIYIYYLHIRIYIMYVSSLSISISLIITVHLSLPLSLSLSLFSIYLSYLYPSYFSISLSLTPPPLFPSAWPHGQQG
jgi:hypothetical protein